MPAWAISALAHLIAAGVLALVYPPERRHVMPRVITSSAQQFEDPCAEDESLEDDEPATIADLAGAPGITILDDVPQMPMVEAAGEDPPAPTPSELGTETLPPAAVLSKIPVVEGFASRGDPAGLAAHNGGGRDTEAAVDRALTWLAAHQRDDGSWSFNLNACPQCRGACRHSGGPIVSEDRAGATAMALLPFLGRGHTHRRGPYTTAIDRGINYLAARAVRQRGVVYAPTNGHGLYTQGLVGIALSECYGMTRDQRLAAPTQLVINHIVKAQHPRGGGWRYGPGQAGDTSALGWQIMALTSARMAYLEVAPTTISQAMRFLDAVQVDSGAAYGYMDPSEPLPGRSAIGLLCRMHLGWKKDHPALRDGVSRLAALGPTDDLYYDYYATQIMHHMGGDAWVEWNRAMKGLLLRTQATEGHEAGSWHEGVAGRFSAKSISPAEIAGRLYCTSLATMILEVYYRHLPLYRTESVHDEFRE